MTAVVFAKINACELEEINKFLLQNYFGKEPMCLKLGIEPEKDVRGWLPEVTRPILEQQVSECLRKLFFIF